MIWFFSFFLFFFILIKDKLFLNSYLILDNFSLYILRLVPLIILLIYEFIFPFFRFYLKNLYFFSFGLVISLVSLTFLLNSSFLFLLVLEITVVPIVVLILNFSKIEDKISSVLFMLFINLLGSIPFFFYSSYFEKFYSGICILDLYYISYSVDFFFLFSYLFILLCKIPLFMFHFWLTKAHVRASGSCSMLLARLMLKLGTFGVLKFTKIFNGLSFNFLIFLSLGLLRGILFSVLMVRFLDVKFMVACSSILHISLIAPFLLFMAPYGILGSIFIIVGHGYVSYYLFYLVTLFYEYSNNRSYDFNKSLESVSKDLVSIFFVFVFLNLGVPPFLRFIREFYFCVQLMRVSYFSLSCFSVVMLLGILFSIFLLSKTLFGKKVGFFKIFAIGMFYIRSYFFLFSLFFSIFLFSLFLSCIATCHFNRQGNKNFLLYFLLFS